MIDDKGVTVLGVCFETQQVAGETPDGEGFVAKIDGWFDADGTRLNSHIAARRFAFHLNGIRYDPWLDGMSEEQTVIVDEAGVARASKAARLRMRHAPGRFHA